MIPASFDYVRASSVEEAVGLLGEHGEDAKLLAGGHSLLPLMKLRLALPAVVIDVGRIAELSFVDERDDHVAVGALTCHHDLDTSPLVRRELPLLAAAAHSIGDPQVRHRGTIGGSLVHGDPASDLPAVALAARATMVARGPDGQRTIDADDFFTGFLETALRPGEVLTEVRFPKAAGVGWSFQKFTRRAQDWAIVGVATVGGGVALVNMGSTPLRAAAVEQALAVGAPPAEAAEAAAEQTAPPGDLHAGPDFRAHLARVLVRRALEEASR